MRKIAPILILMVSALLSQSCAADKSWTGKCVGVSDGDTIRVMYDGKPRKIRLYGIDCPEQGQAFGNRAKQFTADMVFGKIVRVEALTKDRYGRTVAWVSVNGKSLNKELVGAGLAWWLRDRAPHDKDLKNLQHKARQARIGLWSQPDPVPPWKFRKK